MLWHLHPVWYVLQANCASFIESLIDFCIYDDILDTMQHCQLHIYVQLLHFKLSKLGQILCVDKTGFSRLGHIFVMGHIKQTPPK